MLDEEVPGKVPQLQLEVREVDRLHRLAIDAGPDAMRMAAALLLVEDDHTWLTGQAELRLDLADGLLEDRYGHVCRFRRAETESPSDK